MRSSNSTNKLSRLEARMAVKAIKRSLSSMMSDSRVMERSMRQRHETFGLFRKEELNLGTLLGQGGFSDVYSIDSFTPEKVENDDEFDEHQTEVRQFYREAITPGKYVLKRLKIETSEDPEEFCNAATGLVFESQFLCSLSHKNILKIRGWASGGIQLYADGNHEGFFLVLDRLTNTLQDRIDSWRQQKSRLQIDCEPKDLQIVRSRHIKRVTNIAGQIADALHYLHSKGIVFRDLKPGNVGFDAQGTVKLFDFGLARELPDEQFADDIYSMSGIIGTQRYMAPEVALSKKYNQKVDTYSWSMLYWSCLNLEKPFAGMDSTTHRSTVCKLGCRPSLDEDLPQSIEKLLQQSWSQDVATRLTMAQVCKKVKRVEAQLSENLDGPVVHNDSATCTDPGLKGINKLVSMAA